MAASCAVSAQINGEVAAEIQSQLATANNDLLGQRDYQRDRDVVERFYAQRQFTLAWFDSAELSRAGLALIQTLRSADEHGLRSDDYDGATLMYHAIDHLTNRSAPASDRVKIDVGLSVAATRLLRHLHFGRIDPRSVGFRFEAPRAPLDIATYLSRLANGEDVQQIIVAVEPQYQHFQLLKRALQHYRLLALDPELTNLPAFKERSIKPGEPYEGISALRQLLIALGDLPVDAQTSNAVLDESLSAGLKRFQLRHGLGIDGALGRKTFAALTTPFSARVQQLAFTLERWRWLPEFSAPPIIVNIPQFRLFAFQGLEDRAADILQMDVIVGKTVQATQTPVFMADMKYVVFRPYWDVPESILQKEMLPEIHKNSGYLAKNNLEIVSASDANAPPLEPTPATIEQLAAGALRLHQVPGEDNALGLVKLMLPNPHNVYLHSTPAKRLFNEPRRAFSHGCIRVSDPVALVEHVLRNTDGSWTRESIEAAMHDDSPQGNNRHVFLKKPIPVLIVYGTAIVLEDGTIQFFEDIYGHDAKLSKLLRRQSTFK